MAEKHTMTEREREIATQIRDACKVITPDLDLINEANDAKDAIGAKVGTTKLAVMSEVAKLSSAGKWLPGEVIHATKFAASLTNNPDDKRTEKSLATFLSEMNAIAHPKVRDRFPTLLQAIEAAWATEEQEMVLPKAERGPMPVRKWASRKYHAVTQITRAVKDGKADIHTADDVVQHAIENDPDHNPERVAKRLESLAATLHDIFVDFANDDVGLAHKYVSSISADDLIASRKVKLAAIAKAQKEHKLAQTTATADKPSQNTPITKPKPVATPVATQETAPEPVHTTEPAEGASDILGEILNDPAPGLVAHTSIEQHITELAA